MVESGYEAVVARKSDAELLEMLGDHEKYVDEMILTVIAEIRKRGLHHPLADVLEKELTPVPEPELPLQTLPEVPEEKLPMFYTQSIIFGFSVIFSTLFGGIMLAMNVAKVNRKAVWQVLLISAVFMAATDVIAYLISPQNIFNLVFRVVGGLLLAEFLWNRYLGKGVRYKKRSPLVPVIIGAALVIIALIYFKLHPEYLHEAGIT